MDILEVLSPADEIDILQNVYRLDGLEPDVDDDVVVIVSDSEDVEGYVEVERHVNADHDHVEDVEDVWVVLDDDDDVGRSCNIPTVSSYHNPVNAMEGRGASVLSDVDSVSSSGDNILSDNDVPEDPFRLDIIERQWNNRFGVFNGQYTFQFTGAFMSRVQSSSNPGQVLENGFDMLAERLAVLEGIAPDARVTLTLYHPDLRAPVCLPFVRFDQLTGGLILRAIEHVAQSFTFFSYDSKIVLKLTVVTDPGAVGRGRGRLSRKKHLQTMTEFARRKKHTKRGSIVAISNDDSLCLGRAIATSLFIVSNRPPKGCKDRNIIVKRQQERRAYLSDRNGIQTQDARSLYQRAGLAPDACENGRVSWDAFQGCLTGEATLYVHTTNPGTGPKLLYAGQPRHEQSVDIFWWPPHTDEGGVDGHYDAVNSAAGLYGTNEYCRRCFTGYSNTAQHPCTKIYTCRLCSRQGFQCFKAHSSIQGGVSGAVKLSGHSCSDCGIWFPITTCYDAHKANGTCISVRWCEHCNTGKKVGHKCDTDREKTCHRCKSPLGPSHRCHMTIDTKANDDRLDFTQTKYIFYDFESMSDGDGKHIPNLCVIQLGCGGCYASESEYLCPSCPWRSEIRTTCVPGNFKREVVFSGSDTARLVGRYFSRLVPLPTSTDYPTHDEQHPAQTQQPSDIIVVAHYAKGYDNHFILKALLDCLTVPPSVIMTGSKILDMAVGRLKFRDSHNYIPTALKNFCKTFDLVDGIKGYFPHLFNTIGVNQTAVLNNLPPLAFYDPDGMSTEARHDLMEWYSAHEHDSFDMQGQLLIYCRQDVSILRRGCAVFIDTFMSLNSVNPFYECLTLPHACMLTYRRNYLVENTIAIIPPNGYEDLQPRTSKVCHEWLASIERDRDMNLDREVAFTTVAPPGARRPTTTYKVDGYHRPSKTVYELLGCWWHGCLKCFPNKRCVSVHYGSGTTLEDRYDRTMFRLTALHTHPDVDAIHAVWECHYKENRNIENDRLPEDALESLKARDAFYGGRTNGIRLHKKCEEGEKIRYADICSLYPYVCKRGRFPVSHPVIVHNPPTERLFELDGLIKCDVLPPTRLYHPLLPYRVDGKLYFPLCRSCAVSSSQTACHHSDDERAWVGTYTTIEVHKAVRELGYLVRRIFSAWHFERFECHGDADSPLNGQGLFTGYVDDFYKLKQEASGYPPECLTEDSKAEFVEEIYKKEGVRLDPSKIAFNPGKRIIAKIMMNSHWGKFGQSNDKTHTAFVTDEHRFYSLFYNQCVIMHDCVIINDNTLLVVTSPIEEHQTPHTASNPVVASWVTAQARLCLYDALQVLGESCLYFDTDSVLFVERDDTPCQLKMGDSLGEWTDELEEGNWIEEFVTCGPKNYAYRLHHTPRKGTRDVVKIRGFTLTHKVSSSLNFESLVKTATTTAADRKPVTVTYPHQLKRSGLKRGLDIHTTRQDKQYQFCYTKRRIVRDPISGVFTHTVPYGYITTP